MCVLGMTVQSKLTPTLLGPDLVDCLGCGFGVRLGSQCDCGNWCCTACSKLGRDELRSGLCRACETCECERKQDASTKARQIYSMPATKVSQMIAVAIDSLVLRMGLGKCRIQKSGDGPTITQAAADKFAGVARQALEAWNSDPRVVKKFSKTVLDAEKQVGTKLAPDSKCWVTCKVCRINSGWSSVQKVLDHFLGCSHMERVQTYVGDPQADEKAARDQNNQRACLELQIKLNQLQRASATNLAYFAGLHPTVSHRAIEDIPLLQKKHMEMFEPLLFSLLEDHPNQAKVQQARGVWKSLKEFKCSRKELRERLHEIGEELEGKLHEILKSAKSFALYIDESRNRQGATTLVIVASYIDSAGVFHTDLLKTIDVSDDKTGKGLHEVVSQYLRDNNLLAFVFHILTDGASAVCAVTGPHSSFVKRFSDAEEGANGTWCLAHRMALVMVDALLSFYKVPAIVAADEKEDSVRDDAVMSKKEKTISNLSMRRRTRLRLCGTWGLISTN